MTGKNAVLFVFVVVLTLVGVGVLLAPVFKGGPLTAVSAMVGGGALALAVTLALPVEIRAAFAEISPLIARLRSGS